MISGMFPAGLKPRLRFATMGQRLNEFGRYHGAKLHARQDYGFNRQEHSPERIPTALVSSELFATLGVTATRGRLFTSSRSRSWPGLRRDSERQVLAPPLRW
jgi:hypothetical protein